MTTTKSQAVFFVILFLAGSTLSAGESPFDASKEAFRKSLLKFYEADKLFEPDSYPALRKIVALKFVADFRETVRKEWGDPSDPFVQWIERHPELSEEFLTAIDLNGDDIPAALNLMKRLCTEFPEKAETYPGLTVAAALVWDQPDSSGFAGDSREQFKATPPKSLCTAKDNFLFYTKEDYPEAENLRRLPWEFLVYVVCNKRSSDEREWVFENYKDEKNVPGKAYDDVPYNQEELKPDVKPALEGKPYSLENIRQFGGVCTARADFALPVGRTLGIPTFYGGAGFPRYYGGHSWVMWLDIEKVEDNGVVFQFKEEGRANPRYFVAGYDSPQTGHLETDENLRLRFHRAGKDLRAYRHAKLLMRCYRFLVAAERLSVEERIDFLREIQRLSPKNVDVWREVAALGRNRLFGAEHRQTVQDLARMMREDLADFPNELSGLTTELISFPEIRDDLWKEDRWRVFKALFETLEAQRRPDLLIAAVIDFNRIRLASLREKADPLRPTDVWLRHMTEREGFRDVENAVFMLKNLAFNFFNEISLMDRVFDEMESVMEIPGHAADPGGLSGIYADYAKRLETAGTHFPKEYRRDVFRRFLAYARKHHDENLAREMKERLDKLEAEDKQ